MSHYPVIVCLPPTARADIDDALAARLAPYDENRDMEPYRDYIENWQDTYGRALKMYGEHPEGKPAGLDEMNVAEVLSAYQGEQITEESPDDSSVVMFYRMSTYNPQSKWDWWVIGGRWLGHFPVKDAHHRDQRLITGSPGTFGNKAGAERVDGGPRGLLDFEALRTIKADEAAATYDKWSTLVDGTPEAKPWSAFVAQHDADPEGFPIDRARREYGEQPRVAKARQSKDFRWVNDVVEEFAPVRDLYSQRAAEQAVPGFALLDLEGRWLEPGRMGWFGMSSDTEDSRVAYYARANAYLDALADDAVIVVVDCHI